PGDPRGARAGLSFVGAASPRRGSLPEKLQPNGVRAAIAGGSNFSSRSRRTAGPPATGSRQSLSSRARKIPRGDRLACRSTDARRGARRGGESEREDVEGGARPDGGERRDAGVRPRRRGRDGDAPAGAAGGRAARSGRG